MSEAVAQLGNQVIVLTTDNTNILPTQVLPIDPTLSVHKVWTFDYRTIFGLLSSKKKATRGNQFAEKNKQNKWIQLALRTQRSFPFLLFLAEGNISYIISAYRKAVQIIQRNKITVVYTSFMPYADHIVGYWLKRRFPNLIWVADFRDLHEEPLYNNTIWHPVQRWFEKKILRKADIITSVSQGISRKLQAYHHNVHTITKGVHIRQRENQFQKFTIAYTGSLFGEFRDPTKLWKSISHLIATGKIDKQDIQILYAGKDGGQMKARIDSHQLEGLFIDCGFLSRDKALSIQNQSHINLLLTSAGDDHYGLLTGKLFEYLEAQNPILCLINGAKDPEIESLFKEVNAGVVAYHDDNNDTVIDFIYTKYIEWKQNNLVKSTIDTEKLQEQFGWMNQAKKLTDAIANVNL